jgi:hypothetical protein
MEDEPDRIKIDYMILADYAEAIGGKLNMIGGGWNVTLVPFPPGRSVRPFALAIGLSVPYTHTNRKFALTVDLVDADGNPLRESMTATVEAGRPPGIKPGTPQPMTLALLVQPEFPGPGRYKFNGAVDNEPENHVAFDVMATATAPPGMVAR